MRAGGGGFIESCLNTAFPGGVFLDDFHLFPYCCYFLGSGFVIRGWSQDIDVRMPVSHPCIFFFFSYFILHG